MLLGRENGKQHTHRNIDTIHADKKKSRHDTTCLLWVHLHTCRCTEKFGGEHLKLIIVDSPVEAKGIYLNLGL